MFSIKSYYQLLDLQASNASLIDLYSQSLHKQRLEDNVTLKMIAEKIEIREKIKTELNSCLGEKFISRRARLISTFCSYTLPVVVETKYRMQTFSNKNTSELILEFEVQNIRNYYKILFDQTLSRGVTDLLLDQKRRVESCLTDT